MMHGWHDLRVVEGGALRRQAGQGADEAGAEVGDGAVAVAVGGVEGVGADTNLTVAPLRSSLTSMIMTGNGAEISRR